MNHLTNADRKWWAPATQVMDWIARSLPSDAKVLEVGPGHCPFSRATTFVDFQDQPSVPKDKMVKCDLTKDRLPFEDKSFDFVFARHVLEDMFDPFPLCAEMSRVAKAGYVETPSPIAEMCRGIDGNSPPYRGYHHHRFIIWTRGNELRFVSKYPLIEYLTCNDPIVVQMLRGGPRYWNTYFMWRDEIKVRHLQNPLDFMMPADYGPVLQSAMEESRMSSDAFWSQFPERTKIKPIELRSHASSNS